MSAADSAPRDWAGARHRARCPSMIRAGSRPPVARFGLTLTRAVCGYERMCRRRASESWSPTWYLGHRYDAADAITGCWPPGNIGAPATRALTAAGYTELRQLADVPASELKKLHGVGPKPRKLLRETLERQGMSLGPG